MARIPKTVSQARQNLEASIPLIAERYRQGVETAEWHDAAVSDQAEQLYATKTQAAIQQRKRQAALRQVTNEDWRSRALSRGVNNIGEGIRASLDKWERNFTPVYNRVLAAQRGLPAKTADANQNIDRRLKPIVAAWQGRSGGGG